MIIFIYGSDTFRSRRKLNELKEKYLKEVDTIGSSLSVVDGYNASISGLGELISPASLFARKRMVIIEEIFSNKNNELFPKLLSYLSGQENNENIVIFWDSIDEDEKLNKEKKRLFDYLVKQKFAQNFKQLSNTSIVSWTKIEVEARGGKISRQAANEMAALLGSDLWQINNEINKLLSYKAGKERKMLSGGDPVEIDYEDVREHVSGTLDENIFALTDAVGNKNKALAMKLFEEQLESGATEGYLMAMITRQFKVILMIKEALDQGNTSRKIASITKLHPYVVQKGINQTRNFTTLGLKKLLISLIEFDKKMKSGTAEPKTLINILFAKI